MAKHIGQVVLDLDIDGLIDGVDKACDKATEKSAKRLEKNSRNFLMSEAKDPTGKLASEIKIEKSRYPGGGHAVEAQGPGNYDEFYATFVELGSIKNPEPIPYLRTPLKRDKQNILRDFEGILDKTTK